MDRYRFHLIAGTDWDTTTNTNITLLVYLDNVIWKNITLLNDNNNKTELFPSATVESQERRFILPALYIGLILFALAGSAIVKDQDIGGTIFRFGGIILAFIHVYYIWLATIILIGWILEHLIKRMVQE